jgi:hypothetical protein
MKVEKIDVYTVGDENSLQRYTGTVTCSYVAYGDMKWSTYKWTNNGNDNDIFIVQDVTYATGVYIPQLSRSIYLDNEVETDDAHRHISIHTRNRIIAEILDAAGSNINWLDFLKARNK